MFEVWKLIWPATLSNFLVSLTGLIVIKVVSPLGYSAIAAYNIGERIFSVQQVFIIALSVATTSRVARSWGEKRKKDAEEVAETALFLSGFASVLIMATGYFGADFIVSGFDLNEEAKIFAVNYLQWISLFSVPIANVVIINTIIRAIGDTRTPFLIDFLIFLFSISLIFVLLNNNSALGTGDISGAAIAKGYGYVIALCVIFILYRYSRLPLKIYWLIIPRWSRVKQLVDTGIPVALEQFVLLLGTWGYCWILINYSTESYAAWSIGVQAFTISVVIGNGITMAGAILVGQAVGANDPEKARKVGWDIVRMTVVSMTLAGGVIVIFADSIVNFLVEEREVKELSLYLVKVIGCIQPLIAVNFAISGCLRGSGDTRFPLICTFMGFIACRLSLSFFLFWVGASIYWLYLTLAAEYLLNVLLLLWRFHYGNWNFPQQELALSER